MKTQLRDMVLNRWSMADAERVMRLYESGMSGRGVARKIGRRASSVAILINDMDKAGVIQKRPNVRVRKDKRKTLRRQWACFIPECHRKTFRRLKDCGMTGHEAFVEIQKLDQSVQWGVRHG